jgi:hypothetical protein
LYIGCRSNAVQDRDPIGRGFIQYQREFVH